MIEDEIEHLFTYHVPTPESIGSLQQVRNMAKLLATTINNEVPDCADKSTAFRKLRECVMTANAAIVLN